MNEDLLKKELKQGIIRRVYFLHGKEVFLVKTYADMILNACLPEADEDARDFNLAKFTGNASVSDIADFAQTLPVFAEKRVIMLNDLDIEKLDKATLESLTATLGSLPPEVCVIIYITGISIDVKKPKTKKLIAELGESESAAIVDFPKPTEAKTTTLIIKKSAKLGCEISKENAAHIAKLCLCNLTLIGSEIEKLCAYAGYCGEITRESIDAMTVKQLESSVFALASEITAKRGASSLKLLDELIAQGNEPVVIVSTLAMTFLDFYRAKIGMVSGKRSEQIGKDFKYAPNRVWAIGKAMSAVSTLQLPQLRMCVQTLCDADYKLKSSPASMTDKDRFVIETAIARLLTLI